MNIILKRTFMIITVEEKNLWQHSRNEKLKDYVFIVPIAFPLVNKILCVVIFFFSL